MNKFKKIVAILLVSVMCITSVLVSNKVFATNYGEGDINLAIGFDNNTNGYTINSVTVNGNPWASDQDRFSTSNGNYTVVITVTGSDGKTPRIGWGGNWNNVITSNRVDNGNNNYTFTLTANNVSTANPDNPNNLFMSLYVEDDYQHGEEPGPGEGFDGKAYIIWSCGNGICYKYYDDIPNFDDGNSSFIKDTTIVADNNRNQTFDIKAKYKYWASKNGFDNWVANYKHYKNIEGDIDWTTLNPEDMIGEPVDMRKYEEQAIKTGACTTEGVPEDEFHNCVDQYVVSLGVWTQRAQLQPLGEPDANNSYVSYGDRNFKIVIYNSNYKGIAMGDLSELQYYPAQWTNPFLKRDQFDISGTTKDNPTVLDSILLEKNVRIKEINVNDFHITKIEALDVPEDAVNISKDGNTNDWILSFSSNFYDNVVFKVTDSKGEVSYFLVKRYTVDAWIKFVNNKPVLNADFYFDRNNSYKDFEIKATIVYKDGTEKVVTLEPVKGIDDGLGNITDAYEVDEQSTINNDPNIPTGKGLKKGCFQYTLNNGDDKNIKKVYMNIEYKGSTSTEYAGAYSGSGRGTLANIYDPEEDK